MLSQHAPACLAFLAFLAFLGNGTSHGQGGTPLHSHDYRFNDDALAVGVAYYRAVVLSSLTSA